MAVLRIPSPYRYYTDGESELRVQAETVAQAVEELLERFPGLGPHVMNPKGKLRPFIHLFVNDTNIRDLQGMQTVLKDADVLRMVPSIVGGK